MMIPERNFEVTVSACHGDDTHTYIDVAPDYEETRHQFEAGELDWNTWHAIHIIDAGILARLVTELTWELLAGIPGHPCLMDGPDGRPRFRCSADGKVLGIMERVTKPNPFDPMTASFTVPTDQVDHWLALIDDVLAEIATDDKLRWPAGHRFTDPWQDPR